MQNLLLITTTTIESRAVIDIITRVTGQKSEPQRIRGHIYFRLGCFNDIRVFMRQSSKMGSGGLGASLQTAEQGIDALKPVAVIMVGIAFGINDKKQNIGDILVSEWLRPYDLQRIGTEIILRDSKPDAASTLLNLFRSAELTWDGAKVRFGVILTGEKLVDDFDYRDQLHTLEPEAIGGEMEGRGVYVACHDKKVDWILVKAICDWADGNKNNPDKDKHQVIAATNAASFVLHALQFMPHKKNNGESNLPPDPTRLDNRSIQEIQRDLVLRLSDRNQYGLEDLERLWREYIDSTVDWVNETRRKSQSELTGELVAKATRKGKLFDLLDAVQK